MASDAAASREFSPIPGRASARPPAGVRDWGCGPHEAVQVELWIGVGEGRGLGAGLRLAGVRGRELPERGSDAEVT